LKVIHKGDTTQIRLHKIICNSRKESCWSFKCLLRPCNRQVLFRHCWRIVLVFFKAKFHYAIWSQAGSKLVADLSQTC